MSDARSLNLGKLIEQATLPERDAIHIAVCAVCANEDLLPSQHVGVVNRNEWGDFYVGPSDKPIGIVDPLLTEVVPRYSQFWLWLYPGSITALRHDWTHPDLVTMKDERIGKAITILKKPSDPISPTGPKWRTQNVLSICKEMKETRKYDALPILADALEEAGYEDKEVLEECRTQSNLSYQLQEFAHERLICLFTDDEKATAVRWIEKFAHRMGQSYERLMLAADTWMDGEKDLEERGEGWNDSWTRDDTESYKGIGIEEWKVFWTHYEKIVEEEVKNKEATFFTCSC